MSDKTNKKEISLSFDQCVVILCAASAIKIMAGDRNEVYNNGGIEIKDYWDDLSESFQMMKMKIIRAKSSSIKLGHENPPSEQTLMQLTDSCVDLINYTGFHLANALRSANIDGAFWKIKDKYGSHELYYQVLDLLKAEEQEDG